MNCNQRLVEFPAVEEQIDLYVQYVPNPPRDVCVECKDWRDWRD